MKKTKPLALELPANFELPDNAKEVIFIKNITFSGDSKNDFIIDKCTIAYSFYMDKVKTIYIKGFKHLLQNIPNEILVFSKGVISQTIAGFGFYQKNRKVYRAYNKTDWHGPFPMKFDDEVSLNAGKDYYLLQNTNYLCLTPPKFEATFNSVLKYCEENEFYELCANLLRFASYWFAIYEKQYEKQPLLKLTQGWGWLYFLTDKRKTENAIENNNLMVG